MYEIRVNELANKIIDTLQNTAVTDNELKKTIDHYAQNHVYYRSSEQMKKEFLKDVEKEVRKVIKTQKKMNLNPMKDDNFLSEVSTLIMDQTGASFPDGDPIDGIQQKIGRIVRKYGYEPESDSGFVTGISHNNKYYLLVDILDKAAQKYLSVKSYNDYLSDMWDQVYGDTMADLENWEQLPQSRKDTTPAPTAHQMFGGTTKNPWKESLGEALDVYDNKIELAISDLGLMDETTAKKLAKEMSLDDYLNFVIMVDEDKIDDARKLLGKYTTLPNLESVSHQIYKLIESKNPYIFVPELICLNEVEQRNILSDLSTSNLQKLLANVRGYTYPGMYESSLFTVQLVEEIVNKLKNNKIDIMLELAGNRPGETQQNQAYGQSNNMTDKEEVPNGKKQAKFTDEQGEEEEGEVVSQNSQFTTVRTNKGTKRVPTDNVYVKEEKEIADLIRLSGIKK